MASKKKMRRQSMSPEEILARAFRAKCRFRAAVRFVMQNIYWLEDVEDQELGENVQKNILLLTRKKEKKSLLTLQDKAILNKPAEYREEHEKVHLNRVIGGLKCFRRYPSHVKSQLAGVTYFVYFGPGRTIVRQGDESHALYFLITGDVSVSQEMFDPVVNEMVKMDLGAMGPGNMFGEVSLLHGIPRTATVVSLTNCELLCLKKNDFDVVLKATVQQQWDEVQNSMRRFSYFDEWDEIAIRECCILSKMKIYSAEQTILGDGYGLNDMVYFILKGKCRVVEHIQVATEYRRGTKHYKLYVPHEASEVLDEQTNVLLPSGSIDLSDSNSKTESIKSSKIEEQSTEKISKGEEQSKEQLNIIEEEQSTEGMAESSTQVEEEQSTEKLLKPSSSKADSRRGSDVKETKSIDKVVIEKSISQDILRKSSKLESKDKLQRPASQKTLEHKRVTISNKPVILPANVETHFMQVCVLNATATFGIGENLTNRRIITMVYTECLLIPRYWLMQKNKGNIWNRIQQFLNSHVPTSRKVFREFVNQRKWLAHRKKLVDDILDRKSMSNDNVRSNVPYFIRINEDIEFP